MPAKKIDANQREIVEELRARGYSVQSLATVGRGCPDLIVGHRGRNYLFEVKAPRGRLRPAQLIWAYRWSGQLKTICSAEEAINAICAQGQRGQGDGA